MSYLGYDSAVRIDARAAVADGGSFVLRYLSRGSWTQVTAEEVAEYVGAGLRVGLVFETTANRALAGYGAGKGDAQYVLGQLSALGFPGDMEVFFAVDVDVDPVSVDPYFQGVHDAYAVAGVYGSYRVVHRIEGEFGMVGWQTAAWSNGVRDGAAMVFQSGQQRVIAGVRVDVDYATSLGKWAYGGQDMTPDDLLDYAIPRQGSDAEGKPLTGSTNLRSILAWTDAGWEASARIVLSALMGYHAVVMSQLEALHAQVAELQARPAAGSVTLTPAQLAELEASTRADASAAMLAASKALAEPASAAGPDTPAV